MDKEITPAEPEVLWRSEGPPYYRITTKGQLEFRPSSGRWEAIERGTSAMEEELIRRLLAEHEEQRRLDEHNDKAEEAAAEGRAAWTVLDQHEDRLSRIEEMSDPVALAALRGRVGLHHDRLLRCEDKIASLERRLQELDENLAREVEQRAQAQQAPRPRQAPRGALCWDRGRGIMVDEARGDRAVIDLSNYDNLDPKEHDLLEKLADLWSAWGPEGYLRKRLAEAKLMSRFPGGNWPQLRSELLARPWKDDTTPGLR